jgi:NDP-sugar pyrophosphorylase family protein
VNIIIPMAHPDEILEGSEYQYPKPLIDLHGKPLIEYVVENLSTIEGINKLYFIVKESTCSKYHIDNTIKLLCPKAEIVYLKNQTSGAVCSILMAIDQIPHNEECIIVNSDQILLTDLNDTIAIYRKAKVDAGVITFSSVHPRWSYVLTEGNTAVQFAEKNPISKNAIAGFYYFRKFANFISNACKTIADDDQLNGKFYVSAVLNQFILAGKNIITKNIASNNYLSLYSDQKIKEFDAYLYKQNK